MTKRVFVFLVLCFGVLSSFGCTTYQWRRPQTVVIGTVPPKQVVVTGQIDRNPQYIGENGEFKAVGRIYNYHRFPISIRTTNLFEVCVGSEGRITRPDDADPCWKDNVDVVVVRDSGGRSSFLRIRAYGKIQNIAYDYAAGNGRILTQYFGLLPDYWTHDRICADGSILDWVHETNLPQGQGYCR